MVYVMNIYVHGGCRGNVYDGVIGAAAAAFKQKSGEFRAWTRSMPSYPTPTSQRAEITAVILALQHALKLYDSLEANPHLEVKIYSDSRYAIGCMNRMIPIWAENGWINAAGREVANRDLIEKVSDLNNELRQEGTVEYQWLPRGHNHIAGDFCTEELDEQR